MLCCLNPSCHNPPNPDGTMFCSNCGVGLVVLRNRYRPIKSLGGGGFAKTYLAEDVDKLNEHCVIKQFAPQVQGTASLNKATELFEQEAKRLQQLGKHPQIPTLLAYFDEDNRLYLVQEFIEGQNLLAELQQHGTLNEQKVRELLLDLLDILKTVHQQKVIHRDIKPENIIRHSDGKLVLIDFGASKQLTATVMTQVGTAIGSFGYAPLEQMQGGEAYPASDLYSLGATCFHLLSGIHPWELWKKQGYGWVGSWRQHLQQPVSEEFGRILDKLLQDEYRQRYQSGTEVLRDLTPPAPSPIPPTQPVIATPPPPSPQSKQPNQLIVPQVTPLEKSPVPLNKSLPGLSLPTQTTQPSHLHSSRKRPIYKYIFAVTLTILIGTGTIYLLGLWNKNTTTDTSVNIEPKNAETYTLRGIEKYNRKDFTGAIEDFNEAIKIDPSFAKAYQNRGFARRDLGDKQGAITDFNLAIRPNLEQISKQAEEAETKSNNHLSQLQAQLGNEQVKDELEKQKSQVKAQFTELLKDEQKYQLALESPQLSEQRKDLLKKFKANPQELDKFIAQQSDPNQLAEQQKREIREQKEQAEKKLKDKVLKWQQGSNE
jgi:serine/threonine protein kinase